MLGAQRTQPLATTQLNDRGCEANRQRAKDADVTVDQSERFLIFPRVASRIPLQSA